MIAFLLQGFALGLPAAATPGPLQAYFLGQTMKIGWKKTLPSALAPLLSDGPIILLVLVILAQTPEWFLGGLKVVGGMFILYLAKGAYETYKKSDAPLQVKDESSHRGLLNASVTNLLNPNPYIFWSILAGPILLTAWRESPVHGLSFLAGFYGTLIGGFAILIMTFALARSLGSRLVRSLSGLSFLALLIFALVQIGSGLMTFLPA